MIDSTSIYLKLDVAQSAACNREKPDFCHSVKASGTIALDE